MADSRRPMTRIGYVLKVFPRLSQTFILRELLAHQRAGARVDVFSLRAPRDEPVHAEVAQLGLPVIRLHETTLDSARAAWCSADGDGTALDAWLETNRNHDLRTLVLALGLASEVRLRRVEHLHAHFAKLPARVARLTSGLTGVGFSFTAHARDIFHESVDPDDLARNLHCADSVVTVSEFNRRHLASIEPVTPIYTVQNGLGLDGLSYRDPHDRAPRLIAVGRLVEKKGFADLVEAAGLLRDRGVDFDAELIGDGPLEESLRQQIEQRGLGDRLRLVGPRPQAEVIRAVQESACLVAPCVVAADGDRDGLPTVLVEALALGTPAVSTPVTGIPELIRNEETGLLVPEHSPDALADALERLLTDADLRRRLARAGRELIECEYDVRKTSDRLRTIFETARESG